jgi:hypothetical protein
MRLEKRTLMLCLALAVGGGIKIAAAQQITNGVTAGVTDSASLLADDSGGGPGPSGGPGPGARRDNRDSPRTGSTEPLNNCSDSLSEALQQGTPEFLCWANIRTVERWDTASVVSGLQPGYDTNVALPQNAPTMFRFTMGGFGGFSFPDANPGKAYGGIGAAKILIERRRVQFMAEDGGGLANLNAGGENFLVGLNRGAVRFNGEISPRLSWQGTATNTYGTDAARIAVPLDFRTIGDAEAPAAETVVYGLHSGRMTSGEEAGKLRYLDSRSSLWDLGFTHAYTKYDADSFLVQTERLRLEYLHSITRADAIGGFLLGGHQSTPLDCSLVGGGLTYVAGWGTRSNLNVSGGVAGANPSCGKRAQAIGTGALYLPLNSTNDFYLSAGRDLSDGILEHTVFLNTGAAGIRHYFGKAADMRVSWNGLQGTNPQTHQTYQGMFADLSLHIRMRAGFSEETEIRHFNFASTANNDRTLAVFTLWWSPGQASESTRASLP